eukprot:612916-Pyramimonas_sp.AAC.1
MSFTCGFCELELAQSGEKTLKDFAAVAFRSGRAPCREESRGRVGGAPVVRRVPCHGESRYSAGLAPVVRVHPVQFIYMRVSRARARAVGNNIITINHHPNHHHYHYTISTIKLHHRPLTHSHTRPPSVTHNLLTHPARQTVMTVSLDD